MLRTAIVVVFVGFAGLGTGCTDIGLILQAILGPSNGDGSAGNGGDGTQDPTIPMAALTVTNPTPQLNEEVILQCSIVGTAIGAVTFDFQPSDPRLVLSHTTGTGSLIIEETDIGGAGFTFTCTATTGSGTSPPSNEVVIVPTGP